MLAIFEKNVFLLHEIHFDVFGIFSATLNQSYGRKNALKKKATFSLFRMVMEDTPAKYQLFLNRGGHVISVKVNGSPIVRFTRSSVYFFSAWAGVSQEKQTRETVNGPPGFRFSNELPV